MIWALLVGSGSLLFGAAPAGAATRVDVARSAARYAAAHGYHAGIAVLDTRTGELYASGHPDDTYVSASVVKVLVGARLLLAGRMHGRVETLAYKMITQSDNAATDQLYPLAGGGSLEPWIARHYHVARLGAPSPHPGSWGYTRLVPRGLVQLYAKLKRDPKVAPWLLHAMRHIRRTSSAGEYQWWGLPSATSGAAVKQGWVVAYGHANVNTTGFVDHDRYAVAILTRGPTRTYLGPISRAVTHMARLLLPGGQFPDDVPRITGLSASTSAVAGGTRVVVHGSALTHVSRVLFGNQAGRNLTLSSSSTLTVTTPAHAAGWVDVRIVTTHGTSPVTRADRLRFVAPPTPPPTPTPTPPTAGG